MTYKWAGFAGQTCEVCRTPLVAGAGYKYLCKDTVTPWTDCPPCARAAFAFYACSGEDCDPDYAYHELAHHIVLFRRLPKHRKHWKWIARALDDRAVGHSLHHELRVLALQYVSQNKIGWRPSLDRLVSLSWPGLQDVANGGLDRPARFAKQPSEKLTITRARRFVRDCAAEIDSKSRAVRMYTRALRELRGERTDA